MAKFTVEATITDLPPAKKGRFAGKVRHDALVIKPNASGQQVSDALLPEYASNLLAEGKKVVMYKTNKAYEPCKVALGLVSNGKVQAKPAPKPKAVVKSEPSIEAVMAEAEARNAKMDAIRRSNLPKEVKEELLATI